MGGWSGCWVTQEGDSRVDSRRQIAFLHLPGREVRFTLVFRHRELDRKFKIFPKKSETKAISICFYKRTVGFLLV